MRNIFKRNQEPIVAPATTTATVSTGLLDNSTESGGARPSQDDMFTYIQDKFFYKIQSIPCECPRGCPGPGLLRVPGEGGRPSLPGGKGRCQHPDTRRLKPEEGGNPRDTALLKISRRVTLVWETEAPPTITFPGPGRGCSGAGGGRGWAPPRGRCWRGVWGAARALGRRLGVAPELLRLGRGLCPRPVGAEGRAEQAPGSRRGSRAAPWPWPRAAGRGAG